MVGQKSPPTSDDEQPKGNVVAEFYDMVPTLVIIFVTLETVIIAIFMAVDIALVKNFTKRSTIVSTIAIVSCVVFILFLRLVRRKAKTERWARLAIWAIGILWVLSWLHEPWRITAVLGHAPPI